MTPPLTPDLRSTDPTGSLRLMVFAMASLAVFLWGATPLATKIAVTALDPIGVGILRTLLAAVVAVPVLWLAGLAPPVSNRGRAFLLVSAVGGYVAFPVLFSVGQKLTSASHGAMILALTPIFTGLINAGLDRRRPAAAWWLGSALALAGTALLVGETIGFSAGPADTAGDLLVLIACATAAAGYVAGARAAREAGTWSVTLWGITLGGLLLLPALPFFVAPQDIAVGFPGPLAAVLYLALISSIVAYGAWNWALAKSDIGATGSIQFAQPVVGLLLAIAVLGESLSLPLVASGTLIIFGVALARRPPKPEPKPQTQAPNQT